MSTKFLSLIQQQSKWAQGRPMYLRTTARLLQQKADLGKPMSNVNNNTKRVLTKRDWSIPQQGKRAAPKRDWSRPVDKHADKYPEETPKLHDRHVNKFSKPAPKRSETVAQRKERKKKEEELAALAKEEERQRRYIEERKAKQKAREQKAMNQQMKDVYIPEIINTANLSRVLGVRFGNDTFTNKIKNANFLYVEQVIRTMEELNMGNTSHDRSKKKKKRKGIIL